MQRSFLADAPEDILQLIFTACSKDDLIKLSTVNKCFRVLLEPQIYHTIAWLWEEDSTPPVTLLLRTILARPDLATYVRDVKLTGNTFHLPPFRMKLPPKIPIPKVEIDQMIAAVKISGVPDSELWIDKLGGDIDSMSNLSIDDGPQGNPMQLATIDAVLALLLSRLPNLVSLSLGPNFAKETTILGSMFTHALCGGKTFGFSKFEMLKDVHFSPRIDIEQRWGDRGNDDKPPSLCALTFFSAPAIEHIAATIEEPETFQWPGITPSPNTLTSLDITLLREGTLSNILSVCSNLQSLAYNFYADKRSPRSGNKFYRTLTPVLDSHRLISSLSPIEDSLKSLALTAFVTPSDWDDGSEGEPDSIDAPINLSRSFHQLEMLEIPMVFLLGYESSAKIKLGDVLPPNVRSLTLTDDTYWHWFDGWGDDYGQHGEYQLLDIFEEFIGNYKEYTPRLERLCMLIGQMDPWQPDALQRFENLRVEAGLEVELKVVEQIHDYGVCRRGEGTRDYFWPRIGRREN